MRFEEYELKTDQYGFQFAKSDIMLGDVWKTHCNKCGKYLFTETDTENGIKRTDDNRDYRYDEIADEFICDDCDNER